MILTVKQVAGDFHSFYTFKSVLNH